MKKVDAQKQEKVSKEKRVVELQPSRIGRSQSQMFLRGRSAAEKLAKLQESRRQNQDSTRSEGVIPT